MPWELSGLVFESRPHHSSQVTTLSLRLFVWQTGLIAYFTGLV